MKIEHVIYGRPNRAAMFLRAAKAHARLGRIVGEDRAAFLLRYVFRVLPALAHTAWTA